MYFGHIKIALAFRWDNKKYRDDAYVLGVTFPFPFRNDELSLEEASKILAFLSVVGYKHKRYKYE